MKSKGRERWAPGKGLVVLTAGAHKPTSRAPACVWLDHAVRSAERRGPNKSQQCVLARGLTLGMRGPCLDHHDHEGQ